MAMKYANMRTFFAANIFRNGNRAHFDAFILESDLLYGCRIACLCSTHNSQAIAVCFAISPPMWIVYIFETLNHFHVFHRCLGRSMLIIAFCNVIIRRKRRHYYSRQNVYRVSAIRECSRRLYTYLFYNVKCQPFRMHSRVAICVRLCVCTCHIQCIEWCEMWHGGGRGQT